MPTVVIVGAKGFVGQHLAPALEATGHQVRCGSRTPHLAERGARQHEWVHLDLDRDATVSAALEGAQVCVLLARVDAAAVAHLAQAATTAGVEHLVVLTSSSDLRDQGELGCTVLRAGMVIGEGSEGWTMCRDLGMRAPMMFQPAWFKRTVQPLWVGDLVAALLDAVERRPQGSFDLPGPEDLTTAQLVEQIATLRHMRPRVVPLQADVAGLSALWLRMFTRVDRTVAERVVRERMHQQPLAQPGYWAQLDTHTRVGFSDAARRMLRYEKKPARIPERFLESIMRRAAGAGLKRTEPQPEPKSPR